jgi:phage-related protein
MLTLKTIWSFLRAHRVHIIALLLVVILLAPPPANAQFGFLTSLLNLVSTGLGSLNNVMTSVNTALRNVIGPILEGIQTTMNAVQQIMNAIFDFQRNVIYPEDAINRPEEWWGK